MKSQVASSESVSMLCQRIRSTGRWLVFPLILCVFLYFILWFSLLRTSREEYKDWVEKRFYLKQHEAHQQEFQANFSKQLLNINHFHPDPNAGRNGRPVLAPQKDYLLTQKLYEIHKYNVLASDMIPLVRSLPDVSGRKCREVKIDLDELPETSVIIVFHNEVWSVLFRTVWSVISRSPRQLLREIILVDDASDIKYLKKPVDRYVKMLPVAVEIVRAERRLGPLQAKVLGAKIAKAPILTFLDAHCECSRGWLENLMHRMKGVHTRVVCPVIDVINEFTFGYKKNSNISMGVVNWQLNFMWVNMVGKRLQHYFKDETRPFSTPVMSGGIFSIYKDYFFEIGAYDPEMKVSGGEDIEMSFRVWLCGGSLEIVPCSHVGHVFRKSSPYTYPDDFPTVASNLARAALIWMDEWADFFFNFSPTEEVWIKMQNVADRLELKKRLKCNNFEWFLNNVWPEHSFPKADTFFGKIRNAETGHCMIKIKDSYIFNQFFGIINLVPCMDNDVAMFVYKQDGSLMLNDNLCLHVLTGTQQIVKYPKLRVSPDCPKEKWRYDNLTQEIIHVDTKRCLERYKNENFTDDIIVTECRKTKSQQWIFETVSWR